MGRLERQMLQPSAVLFHQMAFPVVVVAVLCFARFRRVVRTEMCFACKFCNAIFRGGGGAVCTDVSFSLRMTQTIDSTTMTLTYNYIQTQISDLSKLDVFLLRDLIDGAVNVA